MNIPLRRISLIRSHINHHIQLPIIGSSFSTSSAAIATTTNNMVNRSQLSADVKKNVKENFVMVYSKSYCPYCKATKSLLESLKLEEGKHYKVIELDQVQDGSDIQDVLASEITKQRTVPQVFINQEFIGGNSDLQAIKGSKLEAKLIAPIKA